MGYVAKPWQTSGCYVSVFIAFALVVLPLLTTYMRSHIVQAFRIPSASMAPTLLPGDYVFADMHYNCPGCKAVQRGDIAIFTYPNDRTVYYVKRVVALPGDRIRVLRHQVFVNDQALAAENEGATELEHWGDKTWQVHGRRSMVDAQADLTVPPGQIYVLGDNRSASVDSREFGSVPLADVVGHVRQIWFSRGDGAIRWSRIGDLVR